MKYNDIKPISTRILLNRIYNIFGSLFFLLAVFFSLNADAALPTKRIGFKVTNSDQNIINQAPVVIDGRAQKTSPQAAPSFAMEPAVEGFGDKVPLTIALQQILPQGYGYTLGDGVDPGQLVSWRGGRPWSVVLQDMLKPSALSYNVNGRSVAINGAGVAPTIVTGIPPLQPVQSQMQQAQIQQPQMQKAPVQEQVVFQPIEQPMMMQPVPQPYIPQQQMVMQPQPIVVQQPVIMQQPQMIMQPVPQQQVMMQQPVMMDQQAVQMQPTGPQPLSIESPAMFLPQAWEARPGQTLRTLLREWSSRVGVELNWIAEFDYPIMASMNMTGTFEEAVRTLLTGFDAAKPTPRGRLHYNPAAGQSILIVEADGNHYGD